MTSEVTGGAISQMLTTGVTFSTLTESYSLAPGKEWLFLCRLAIRVIQLGRLSFTIQLSTFSPGLAFPHCPEPSSPPCLRPRLSFLETPAILNGRRESRRVYFVAVPSDVREPSSISGVLMSLGTACGRGKSEP